MNSPRVESELRIEAVSKTFTDPKGRLVEALRDVSLTIAPGEFVVLLGPSGCGKTTLLRSIAGFEEIDSGTISLGSLRLNEMPANKRPVNTVFQSYALFPHMSVAANVAFGLESESVPRAEIDSRVAEMLDLVHLGDLADRKPSQMSGGQQQRAALARALAKRPQVLLLDEPLAALDLKLRRAMQTELKRIHRATGTTFLFVTHDQNEAMALGDRIAVFSNGQLRQFDTPSQIYDNPADEFVASFIGESTAFVGKVSGGFLEFEELKIPLRMESVQDFSATRIVVRPEAFSLRSEGALCGEVTIQETIYSGDVIEVEAALRSGKLIKIQSPVEFFDKLTVGSRHDLYVNPEKVRVLNEKEDTAR
jgi:spermidine/putrescine transport system ATP-binding protein